MKTLVTLLLLLPSLSWAQKVDLKDIETGGEETTIAISKGKKNSNGEKCEPIWELTEGSTDIVGEATVMLKEASNSWKKACDTWKKEFRGDNKDNKIILMNCGKSECSQDTAGRVCASKATYKIKTKLN